MGYGLRDRMAKLLGPSVPIAGRSAAGIRKSSGGDQQIYTLKFVFVCHYSERIAIFSDRFHGTLADDFSARVSGHGHQRVPNVYRPVADGKDFTGVFDLGCDAFGFNFFYHSLWGQCVQW